MAVWPWALTLTSQHLYSVLGTSMPYFMKIGFDEIYVFFDKFTTNAQTHKPTNSHDHIISFRILWCVWQLSSIKTHWKSLQHFPHFLAGFRWGTGRENRGKVREKMEGDIPFVGDGCPGILSNSTIIYLLLVDGDDDCGTSVHFEIWFNIQLYDVAWLFH